MNPVDYLIHLTADVRYRVRFEVEKGAVVSFTVQLERFQHGGWVPIVRYDTAHGFAHRDRYQADGTVTQHEPLPVQAFNEALTFAVRDIKANWEQWVQE